MTSERDQLLAAIEAINTQRAILGDVAVDAMLSGVRAKLDALTAPTPAEQSLKQVTILFLDVVGSTTLSQYLDPEEIHHVMDGALVRCTAIVENHRGKVLQYAGDSLLAIFGFNETREDDPERAVRCGLDLIALGAMLYTEVQTNYNQEGFNVRVGIHTGGVLLGGGIDAESTVRGLAVNIAARMEQTALTGALRISHSTYIHVRGVFDVEQQPPIQVKGVDEPIVSYLVLRLKPRSFRVTTRGIEGVETRMVGRDPELTELKAAFIRLYEDMRMNVVTVIGEAGIGKSRLLYEFENWAEARTEGFYIFQGRASPQTQSQPYGLLRDVLAWRLQIADDDSMETAKQKIEAEVVPLFAMDDGDDMAQAHAHILGHLIGLDFTDSKHVKGIHEDGKQIRNRGFHAAAQMFRRVTTQHRAPIVLLLDDLHWADDGTLDFLAHLKEVCSDVPILILALTRPTLLERRGDWSSTDSTHHRIELLPLDRGFNRELANELLKKLPKIPAVLRELITGGGGGNPFYMEELVKMLVDNGAINTGAEHWSVDPTKLLSTHVPQTLTGVLQARLDGLQPAEKLALQQASVIGSVFWDQALAALDPHAIEVLPSLIQRELVVAQQNTSLDSGLEGIREYTFKHQILHQVTYDTLLKTHRRALHAAAAQWLAGLNGARSKDFLGSTAEHFEKAGDNASACEYFTRAAEHAKNRFAHAAALTYVEQALTLTDPDDHATLWRLLIAREDTLNLQGRRAEQRLDLDALLHTANTLNDDRKRTEVVLRRCLLALLTGDFRAMERTAREACTLAERTGDGLLTLRSQHRLSQALLYLNDYAACNALAQQGLITARTLGAQQVECLFLNTLSVMLERQDEQMRSLDMDQQCLQIIRALGERQAEGLTLANLGEGWLKVGEHRQALHFLEDGLRLLRSVGDRRMESMVLSNLSILALRQGENAQALARAQAALDIAIAIEGAEFQVAAGCALGQAELALGRTSAALKSFQRARTAAFAHADARLHDASAGIAQVALAQGDTQVAMQAIEALMEHLETHVTLEGTESPRRILLTCHQVLLSARDLREAALLERAHRELQQRAATLSDPALRQGFLNNIPEHREIVATWTAQRG
jgi:predicted ATPase/class 3 adenylate cyclase